MTRSSSNLCDSEMVEVSCARGLIGRAVCNRQGERLGWVDDLVIELDSGSVSYVTIVTEPASGSQACLAIPFDMMELDSDDKPVIVNLARSVVEGLAGPGGDVARGARQVVKDHLAYSEGCGLLPRHGR